MIIINYVVEFAILVIITVSLNLISTEYQYMVPFYLPGIPTNTEIGFKLNIIWQFGTAVYSASSYAFFDGLTAILLLHVLLLTNILCNKVRIMSEMAAEGQHAQNEMLDRIKNVIVLQIEMKS